MDEIKRVHGRGRPHHLILVPCPLQGHLSPMLHLANLLHSKGFSVTLILIHPSSSVISRFDNIVRSFHHYSDDFSLEHLLMDGSPDDDCEPNKRGDLMHFLFRLNMKSEEPFREFVARVPERSRDHVHSIIVYDATMYFAAEVADGMEIPRLVLRTSSAANFLGLSLLNQKACLPAQEQELENALTKELPSLLRARDVPVFDKFCKETAEQVLRKIHHATETASAIVWNTLVSLEHPQLRQIQSTQLSPPIFPVGPLHRHVPHHTTNGVGNGNDDDCRITCMSFLDSHPPNSVVYVNTGTLVKLSPAEIAEMAKGLVSSGQPFLWVIRPSSDLNSADDTTWPSEDKSLSWVPDACDTVSREGLGVVVKWAPQREVLGHPSVGCFWTHNGWNSTLESMSEGVPMLCWPRVGDQRMIAGFVCRVWKVGLELVDGDNGGGLDGEKISRAIKRLMVDEEGREIRKRGVELKKMVDFAVTDGGCSSQSLTKLVEFIDGL